MSARSRVALVVALLLALAGAVGCSRSSNRARTPQDTTPATASAGPDGVQHITVVGTEQFRFRPALIHAHPGRLTITLRTQGSTPHDLQLAAGGASTGPVTAGQPRSVTVTLPRPGTYGFICTFHTRLDMVGKIVVS
jgi:plastocyanin